MTTNAQIGRRLIPLEQIALIEAFDPSTQTRMKSERPFQARVVMIDRDSVLTEEPVATLAERYGFRMLRKTALQPIRLSTSRSKDSRRARVLSRPNPTGAGSSGAIRAECRRVSFG